MISERNTQVVVPYTYAQVLDATLCEQVVRALDEAAWSPVPAAAWGESATGAVQQDLPASQAAEFLQHLGAVAAQANAGIWGFNLFGFDLEHHPPRIQAFRPSPGEASTWRTGLDAAAPTRKLGFCAQLTPANAYQGADLEFLSLPIDPGTRKQGVVIVFPAFCCSSGYQSHP